MIVKPCPFCGDADNLEQRSGGWTIYGRPTWIYCGNCAAQGPEVYISHRADVNATRTQSAWNERATKPTEEV